KTGEMRLSRLLLVVEVVENDASQISLENAKKRNPAAQVGDFIAEALPPLEYGRIAAQSAKQVIVQKVREAERDRQYQEYKDRIGDIVNGIVKRVEYGNVVVDLGRGEAIVRRDEMLPRETFRNGDRIRAFIYDVRREPRGPPILSSTRWPPPRSQKSCSTRTAGGWRSWCPTSSYRLLLAGAARTCGSPHSLQAGISTSSPSRRNRSIARPSLRSAPGCS